MKRFSKTIALAIALLTPMLVFPSVPSSAAKLRVGEVFPEFSGRTITDHALTLPDAATKKPTILVFSFSRTAGKDARLWNERLAKDFSGAVLAYGVIQLESVPKIFRRLAIDGIKSSMPVPVQNRTMVLYRDDQLWRQRLEVQDDNRAYVVLLGRAGTICWMNAGGFSQDAYAPLKTKIAALLQTLP